MIILINNNETVFFSRVNQSVMKQPFASRGTTFFLYCNIWYFMIFSIIWFYLKKKDPCAADYFTHYTLWSHTLLSSLSLGLARFFKHFSLIRTQRLVPMDLLTIWSILKQGNLKTLFVYCLLIEVLVYRACYNSVSERIGMTESSLYKMLSRWKTCYTPWRLKLITSAVQTVREQTQTLLYSS